MKKFLLWSFLLLLLGVIGWFGYKWYVSRGAEINTFSLIPEDAIYVLETDRPIEAWKQISGTKTWQYLQGNAWFASLTSSANSLDSLIKSNDDILSKIGKRTVLFSTHLTSPTEYDFLIVADLGDASGIKFMESYLSSVEIKGLTFSSDKIAETDVVKMYSKSDKSTMYLCLIERYLIASYNRPLFEKSIKAKDGKNLSTHPKMELASKNVGTSGFARVYLNYAMLNSYLSLYAGKNENIQYLSDNLLFGSMYMDESNDLLELNGHVWLKDSAVSYFSALLKSGKGPTDCADIAPERTGFYLGLGFTSFSDFYAGMQENLKKDVSDYDAYMDNIRKTEKFLNISVQEDFVSWVDDELALLELRSAGKGLDNEVALILKAANIEKAKDRLEHIEKMIKRRTPVKFKAVDYQGYRISYLSVKGLFKAVLGKFFARYDKPYYTVLNNYVIFSNHPQTLESIIDDYLAKKTLSKSESYKTFRSNLSDEGTVFVYLNTPSVFQSMKNIATAETRASMDSNQQYITSFRHVAFQLKANGDHFESKLCEQFELPLFDSSMVSTPEVVVSDSMDVYFELPYIYVKNPNEKEYKELYPDSVLHFEVELKYGFKDGSFSEYHPNGEVKLKGKFKKDKRTGTWKAYDADGELIGKREY
jgi:hypothetical protein